MKHHLSCRVLAFTFLSVVVGPAMAQTTSSWKWAQGKDGDFADAANWDNGIPGSLDTAVFDKDASYTVTLTPGQLTTNARLLQNTGNVTLDINGSASGPSAAYILNDSIASPTTIGQLNGDLATLTILNGRLDNTSLVLGQAAGSEGTLNITGNGGIDYTSGDNAQVVTDGYTIGEYGTGTVNVTNGGYFLSDTDYNTYIGRYFGSSGTLNIDGPNSVYNQVYTGPINPNTTRLRVAAAAGSTGEINVSNGATLTGLNLYLILGSGSSGGSATFTATGADTLVEATLFNVASSSSAYFGDGARLYLSGGDFGGSFGVNSANSPGDAVVTFDGVGTELEATYSAGVRSGELYIQNGATALVRKDVTVDGAYGTTGGLLKVTGAGSQFTGNGRVYVGSNGTGLLTIEDGAVANFNQPGPNLGPNMIVSDAGTLRIDGGTLNTWSINASGLGTVELLSGELNVTDRLNHGDKDLLIDTVGSGSTATLTTNGTVVAKDLRVGDTAAGVANFVGIGSSTNSFVEDVYIGATAGGSGQINVDGSARYQRIKASGSVYVGGDETGSGGSGVLSLKGSDLNTDGRLEVADTLHIWDNGVVVLWEGGTIKATSVAMSAGADIDFQGGRLEADEILNDFLNDGIYNAGRDGSNPYDPNTPKIGATIFGDYTQSAAGVLELDYAGLLADEYDQLNVTGTATLAGDLIFQIIKDVAPDIGATFDVLIADSIVGSFDTINAFGLPPNESAAWLVTQEILRDVGGNDILRLTVVSAVPVPPAIWLFGSALAGLGWLRRKQAA